MNPKDQKETYTQKINPDQAEYNFRKEDKRKSARETNQNGSRPQSSM